MAGIKSESVAGFIPESVADFLRNQQGGYPPTSDRRSTKHSKALAFRDARKMEEAREWAAELVRLLRAHDLVT
jgi:hypothetical protein